MCVGFISRQKQRRTKLLQLDFSSLLFGDSYDPEDNDEQIGANLRLIF